MIRVVPSISFHPAKIKKVIRKQGIDIENLLFENTLKIPTPGFSAHWG
jgi:hypothetical protein